MTTTQPPTTPATIEQTLAERGSRYGSFIGHAKVSQAIKAVMRNHDKAKWDSLSDDQRESLEMVAHKIGRIINGDPDYADSWHDVAGYITLVSNRLIAAEKAAAAKLTAKPGNMTIGEDDGTPN